MIQENITVFSTARSLPSRFQDAAGRCSQAVLKRSFYVLPTCGQTRPACHVPHRLRTRAYDLLFSEPEERLSYIPPEKVFSACCLYVAEMRKQLPLFQLMVVGTRMWCRSVLPFLLTSILRYHSRMIPWQFQYCHLTGV